MNATGCGADLDQSARDDQRVVEPCRLPVSDGEIGDDIEAPARLEGSALVDAGGAKHVRPRPLHEAEIIGVIDDARKIGVLEIDAQREAVLAAFEAALRGLIEIAFNHCARAVAGAIRRGNPFARPGHSPRRHPELVSGSMYQPARGPEAGC